MPNTGDQKEGLPRKDLHIFYVLDTSGSMAGTKISTLNHAMEETVEALQTVAKENADAKLKIAIMEFNSGCKWVTPNGPEDLENDETFDYEYLEAGGLTDIGAALTELDSKLSQRQFLRSMAGALMPVIIFMTDGYATDDYEKPLAKIRKNRWFARATKIGFALGDDADVKMICSVVGNSEAVIKTNDLDLFKRLIRFVSVTSSMLVSSSVTQDVGTSGEDIIKQAMKEVDVPKDTTIHIPNNDYNKEPEMKDDIDDDWDDDEW